MNDKLFTTSKIATVNYFLTRQTQMAPRNDSKLVGIVNMSATILPIKMVLTLHFDFQGSVIFLEIFVAAADHK